MGASALPLPLHQLLQSLEQGSVSAEAPVHRALLVVPPDLC